MLTAFWHSPDILRGRQRAVSHGGAQNHTSFSKQVSSIFPIFKQTNLRPKYERYLTLCLLVTHQNSIKASGPEKGPWTCHGP